MVTLTHPNDKEAPTVVKGMRPVNLRTDLAQLADLIEIAFADSMDSGGRAALREMRYLSRSGPTLPLLSRLNDSVLHINLGYVWIEDERLIGNVSVVPTNMPGDFGKQWIIANVGVHPDFQGRGIARKLMIASMEMIRQRNGHAAILTVDINNQVARHLYRKLGFVEQRAWTYWRRSGYSSVPKPSFSGEVHIARRRRNEWQAEYELAKQIRPQEKGGLGWLRPLHESQFKQSFFSILSNWLNLRSTERLVIRNEHDIVAASLWIENNIAGRTNLTLMCDPNYAGAYDDALIHNAVRRYGRSTLNIEHPTDALKNSQVLDKYRFTRQQTQIHMRWDAR